MPEMKNPALYQVGDKLRIKVGSELVGTVTEVRGTQVPGAQIFYRVRVPLTPEPLMMELREDEVEKA